MTEVADEAIAARTEGRVADMRLVLEERNLGLLRQLLACETGALSPREVAWRNPEISESTVRDHLARLVEEGFARKLTPDVETIPNEMPRTYYAASPYTIELLKEMGLWENLTIVYQLYDAMDRPEDINAIENWDGRPEPDWLPDEN